MPPTGTTEKPKAPPKPAAPAAADINQIKQGDPGADPAQTEQGQEQAQTEQTQQAPAPAPPAAPAPKAAAPAARPAARPGPAVSQPEPPERPGDHDLPAVGFRYDMPREFKGRDGVDTLMDACETYGINPDPDVKPKELLNWKYYVEDDATGTPGYIQLVTGGGLKIRHFDDEDWPMDRDTEERLRNQFGAFSIDAATKLPIPQPLPADLTLPAEAVDGISRKQDHRYRRGYLREGGKVEAAKRQKKARPKRG